MSAYFYLLFCYDINVLVIQHRTKPEVCIVIKAVQMPRTIVNPNWIH